MNKLMSHQKETEFDKEVRDIYRERNSLEFTTPSNKDLNKKKWLGNLFTMLALAIISSLITVIVMVTVVEPASPLTLIERTRLLPSNNAQTLASDKLTNIQKATVAIFSSNQVTAKDSFDLNQILIANDALGQGLVLSSDGWVVTTKQVVGDIKTNLWVIAADGYSHKVETVVVDPTAPFIYLKIKAANLPATNFVDYSNLTLGETVWASAFTNQASEPVLYTSQLASLNGRAVITSSDLVSSTDKLDDKYLVDSLWSKKMIGSPVVNSKGEVLGLVGAPQGEMSTILPTYYISSVIDNLFANQQIKRPSLGVSYIQSDLIHPFGPENLKNLVGALVTQVKTPTISKGSKPVEQFIKNGDIILEVDGQKISERSLAGLIQQTRSNSQLELVVKRNQSEVKLNVTLGEILTLPVVVGSK